MSRPEPGIATTVAARSLTVTGRVQGVGFRPFVYRLAHEFGLDGWVRNSAGTVLIHAEGRPDALARFEAALVAKAPPLARPDLVETRDTAPQGEDGFRIVASAEGDAADIHLPPDLFCCDDCLAELETPGERRHRYPFTNCTQCGPRYTIIADLPYDRQNTAMAGFPLCDACRAEYENPLDRRFHAQPLACPECGPELMFTEGVRVCVGADAFAATVRRLADGGIVAVKGIGGYHLMCAAADDGAVRVLRRRKHRPDKPLAVMFPLAGHDGLDAVRESVVLSEAEAAACRDAARPIVLARRRSDCPLSDALAPGLAELGVFLPYSPLHHLLLQDFGRPLVATSGNISGEPVITEVNEAAERLGGIADAFLHHDRPILRPADDSVVRVISGKAQPLRTGRGVAPVELTLPVDLDMPVVALGGHMKATVAIGWGRRAVLSPHIGELDSPRAMGVFQRVVEDLQEIHKVEAKVLICDANPDYGSSRWARARGVPAAPVQHHIAHASALAGENPDIGRWLTFAWDGTGLGIHGSLWGGEAFLGAPGDWLRVASMRPFQLLGGDRAAREPWRCAAALMWEAGRDWTPPTPGASMAAAAWRKGVACTESSAVGRLFDAAAALVLGLETTSFEGQGPMMLEAIAEAGCDPVALPLARDANGLLRTDWAPLLDCFADDTMPAGERAGIFHASIAGALVAQVEAVAAEDKFDAVGLTGGVFQNRLLAETVAGLLDARDIQVVQHRIAPANDGGLAFGQLVEYACRMAGTSGGLRE